MRAQLSSSLRVLESLIYEFAQFEIGRGDFQTGCFLSGQVLPFARLWSRVKTRNHSNFQVLTSDFN